MGFASTLLISHTYSSPALQSAASSLRRFSFSCIHLLTHDCLADYAAIVAAVPLEILHVALPYPSRHQTKRLVSTTMGPNND
jgi:hypothetical protein